MEIERGFGRGTKRLSEIKNKRTNQEIKRYKEMQDYNSFSKALKSILNEPLEYSNRTLQLNSQMIFNEQQSSESIIDGKTIELVTPPDEFGVGSKNFIKVESYQPSPRDFFEDPNFQNENSNSKGPQGEPNNPSSFALNGQGKPKNEPPIPLVPEKPMDQNQSILSIQSIYSPKQKGQEDLDISETSLILWKDLCKPLKSLLPFNLRAVLYFLST